MKHSIFSKTLLICEDKMEKIIKKYRITESGNQEEYSLRYWKSKSIKAKIDAINQLRILYCELKNMDPNEQRLQRVFKITKLSQG